MASLHKACTIHESPTEPITSLGFREPTDDDSGLCHSSHTNPNVPAVPNATQQIGCQRTRLQGGTPVVVEEIGSGLRSAMIDWRGRNAVVARDEAIYLCGIEGRETCYAYEGHKSSVYAHLNYLAIVSPPFFPTATSASATVRNLVARRPSATEIDVTKVTVFEPENNLAANSSTFKQGVREMVSRWGQVYILSNDGNLVCLQEKYTASKLDMLYRKSLYGLALNLAVTPKIDVECGGYTQAIEYGDHLYAKGDWDGAMRQYVQTMGHLQPSYPSSHLACSYQL